MKRKELKAAVNKRIKVMEREVKRMNALLIEHNALLTVKDWQDIAEHLDATLRANRALVWVGLAGTDQDDDKEQPAPESTEDDAALAQNPELPMMILGVLGMSMTKFADSQIQQIRETKEANWIPSDIDVEASPDADTPAEIENAPEGE